MSRVRGSYGRLKRRLGIAAVAAALLVSGSAPAAAIDERITNQALFDKADSYAEGVTAGNCKVWLGQVFDAVAIAAGSSARIGPGLYSGFIEAGGFEIPPAQATRGDVVFVYDKSNPETFYTGMHGAFVVDNLGNGVFNVIDANYSGNFEIERHEWNLNTYLPAFPELEYAVFRLGSVPAAPPRVPVFRFYNARNGAHFYTSSADEAAGVRAKWPTVFTDEGIAYYMDPAKNAQPLYRFYNVISKSHFYTASPEEAEGVKARWPGVFAYEGETYRVCSTQVPGSVPVYRFYNLKNGSHFYTSSEQERAHVEATWPGIYDFEGVAYWLAQ